MGGVTHQHHHHGHGAGEDWHAAVHDVILPEALRGVDLGDDVLEIGPGPGLTTEANTEREHEQARELSKTHRKDDWPIFAEPESRRLEPSEATGSWFDCYREDASLALGL